MWHNDALEGHLLNHVKHVHCTISMLSITIMMLLRRFIVDVLCRYVHPTITRSLNVAPLTDEHFEAYESASGRYEHDEGLKQEKQTLRMMTSRSC